jgi:putative pyruvate formate lyase activating enzyme
MLYLQEELDCHNINLVSPSHFVPQIVRAVLEAVPRGLKLPLVYNTNSYDSLATLMELDGMISIYLPDLKYAADTWAKEYSQAERYVSVSRAAIKEMYRQVGNLVLDEAGVARRGVIVRHLILPDDLAGSRRSLTWLAREVSNEVTVSIMSQYHPAHRAADFPPLTRQISLVEHEAVLKLVEELGLENGWIQGMGAQKIYLPDFDRKRPFAAED